MNDGRLVVNFGALGQAHTDISNAVNVLHGSLDDLKNFAAPLVSDWSGSAQAAYYEQHQIWTDAARALAGTLHSIGRAVDASRQDYVDTEKRATSLFQ